MQKVDTINEFRCGFIGVLKKCLKKTMVLLMFSSHESVFFSIGFIYVFHMQKMIPTRAVL